MKMLPIWKITMNLHQKITLVFSCVSLLCFGQYNSEGVEKSRFRPGIMWYNTGWEPARPGMLRKYDRLMFDITYNDWIGERKTFKMRGPSMGMNVSWLFEIPLVKQNLVSLAVGPGYGFYHMRHDMPIVYGAGDNTTIFGDEQDVGYFGKRKLIGHQLFMPVEFRFRTKGWRHFKVHIGGKIGYQLSLFEKARFEQNGTEVLQKSKASQDVSRLIYSAHVRLGIRNFALYGSYNFNPLYSSEGSTQLHLLQLGITVSLF